MELSNRLLGNGSPYLREAANQPVCWQIYSDEVFKLASELDRPILLDIGAVWCHWCHVMDRESYSDETVAQIINENFVPVKVDRDQMPDVDSRYQSAIGALTGSGGWPLTCFLTPDGKVFYGGTYFPRSNLSGRQGLLTLLPQIADVFARRRVDVLRSADEIFARLHEYELQATQAGELKEETIQEIIANAIGRFDGGFGGFGSSPKFFNHTALHLLAEEALRKNDLTLRAKIELTLDCMSRGGVYDQLGGGFHRYSVDRYWHVPHFEKMLYDNALMLRTYLLGLRLTHKQSYERIAHETADWITSTMQSRDGGFYAHQDADVHHHDDGTYWTWTKKEVESVLVEDEKEIVDLCFDLREIPNETPEFQERNVLRIALDNKEIAEILGKPEAEVRKVLGTAKRKLLRFRDARKPPFVEKTIFADRNGLAISALVEASVDLRERRYLEAAEAAANFIIEKMIDERGKVVHACPGRRPRQGMQLETHHGLLEDSVNVGIALLDLFDVAGNDLQFETAERIAYALSSDFEDAERGGFFDRPTIGNGGGLLSTKKKTIEDTPTPSGNSGAAIFLDRLFATTREMRYFETADRTLKAFAGSAAKMGIYAANFARALRFHLDLLKNVS